MASRGNGCGRGRTSAASKAFPTTGGDSWSRDSAGRLGGASMVRAVGDQCADREGAALHFGDDNIKARLHTTSTMTGERSIPFMPHRMRRSVSLSGRRKRTLRGISPYVWLEIGSFSRRRSGVCSAYRVKGASKRGDDVGVFMSVVACVVLGVPGVDVRVPR